MSDNLVTIEDRDELYHRVFRYLIVGGRVSSAAFKDRRKKPLNRFSADCARLTTPAECLSRTSVGGLRLIGFLAETPRHLGFRVWHDPENDNFAHCTVEGENSSDKCEQFGHGSWPIEISGG